MVATRFPTGSGPTQRQLRVGELIRRTLSDVLARGDIHDPDLARVSITVGEVRTSPDLKIATAFVLPLGGQGAEAMLSALRRNRVELRRAVAKAMTLKFAPELRFEIDETFDRMDETRRLLAQDAVRRDIEQDAGPRDIEQDAGRRDIEQDAGRRDIGQDAWRRDIGQGAAEQDDADDAQP